MDFACNPLHVYNKKIKTESHESALSMFVVQTRGPYTKYTDTVTMEAFSDNGSDTDDNVIVLNATEVVLGP